MNRCKLGDILTIKHGFPFKGENFSNEGKYIILTPGNFYEAGGFKRILGKEKYYLGKFPKEYICKKGDFIVAMTQQAEGLLGSTAFVPEDDIYLHNQRIGLIFVNEQRVDKNYLNYLFRTNEVRKQIRDSASGSKVKHTSPDRIYDVEVYLHDLITQKRIGKLFYAIDRKIENNIKICFELESIAKMVYNYWFLQFDFPDENGKPYKSSGGKMVWNEEIKKEIPEGWKAKKLSDFGNLLMGLSPNSESYNDNEEGYPLMNGAAELQNDKVCILKYTNMPTRICQKDDLIFCIRATIGNLQFAEEEYCLGRGVAAFTPKYKEYSEYLYNVINDILDVYKKTLSGSIIVGITKDDLNGKLILCPTDKIIKEFSKIEKPIITKIRKNKRENQELASLRDFLLPLLMNGQARFK